MKQTTDEQLICKICGKQFRHLGSHIAQAHKITAREYKKKFKMNLTRPLISSEIKEKLHKQGTRYAEHLKKVGVDTRIQKGQSIKNGLCPWPEKMDDETRRKRAVVHSNNWKKNHREQFNKTHREYMRRHPEKRKMYYDKWKRNQTEKIG